VRRWLRYRIQRQDMAWYGLGDLQAEWHCIGRCLFRRPDLIHFFDGEHAAQWLPRWRRAGFSPPLVLSLHQPPAVLDRVIRTDLLGSFDRIVVVAPEQADYLSRFVPAERIRLILLGVDTEYFRPAQRDVCGDRFICLTVGHNYRDYATVRAVALRCLDDRRIEFHVVSPRPTGVEDLPNVRVCRGLDDDALRTLYQQSDVLFMPLLAATANLAALEAAACGLPLLTTSLPALRTYFPNGEAWLCEPKAVDSYVAAIRTLLAEPSRRGEISRAVRARAAALSWSAIAAEYEAVYAEAMGKGER
jgi:glycosyltransferase involved in cell wall biosynthesis